MTSGNKIQQLFMACNDPNNKTNGCRRILWWTERCDKNANKPACVKEVRTGEAATAPVHRALIPT